MNERLRKQLYTYKRSLEDRKVYTGLYALVFLFTFVVYGFFGVYQLVRVTKRKIITIQEMVELNKKLYEKKINIGETRDAMEKVRFYTDQLEAAMPLKPKVESYMVSLVGEAGGAGYKQRNFYIQNVLNDEISLRVRLQGSVGQFVPLMRDIESMERLTRIESFRYSVREETASVEVNLVIYYLER